MTIVVTGATGNLGALVVEALLDRDVEPSKIVAAGRNCDRLTELAAQGVEPAHIDYDDAASLRAAFEGAEGVLLVSTPGNSRRTTQHDNVIRAAEAASVDLLVYTSWMKAATSTMLVAADHRTTEQILAESNTPHVVLRCAGYFESRTDMIPFWRAQGAVLGAASEGRVSSASRADLADAAAAVLTTDGHEGRIYELASDEPYTLAAFATELSRQAGESVPYTDLDVEQLEQRLMDAGLTKHVATRLADYDRATAAGEATVDSGDLRRLVGRPVTELPAAISQALSLRDAVQH